MPDGFAVTVSAYYRFMEYNGLHEELNRRIQATDMRSLDEVFSLSAALQQAVLAAPLPPELEQEITQAVEAMQRRAGPDLALALRSSAVGEDSLGVSFAGQYRSELNVPPEESCDVWKEIIASKYAVTAMLRNIGLRVTGKVLGIVGSGRIALAVARRAAGFDMPLLYTARHRNEDFETKTGARYVSKEELLRGSDFVSLHMPLTPETEKYIGRKELALMQPHAVLINTARGKVVDEAALVEALQEGRIAGAGLDVFESEPLVGEALRALPNVLMTPHKGASSIDGFTNMGNSCAEKIFAALDGKLPPNCLNPEARKVVN